MPEPQSGSLPYLRAVEILADGQWHSYSSVLREAAKAVPPGKAYRTYMGERLSAAQTWARRHGTPIPQSIEDVKTEKVDSEYAIFQGGTRVARSVLSARTLEIERVGKSSDTWTIRLLPPKPPVLPNGKTEGPKNEVKRKAGLAAAQARAEKVARENARAINQMARTLESEFRANFPVFAVGSFYNIHTHEVGFLLSESPQKPPTRYVIQVPGEPKATYWIYRTAEALMADGWLTESNREELA